LSVEKVVEFLFARGEKTEMQGLPPTMKLTGEIVTGRYEKRNLSTDENGAAFYCMGEKAVCKCGAAFIIPSDRALQIVEIFGEPVQ